MIRAVILNLDGIVVNTDECHYRAWMQLAHEQGISLQPELYRKLAGRKRMDSLKVLLGKAERNYTPTEMWALGARKNDLFNRLIDDLGPRSIVPGVMETVLDLRNSGIKVAVASSSENASGILRHLKLYSCFDAVVDGEQIEKGKPDPEVFLTVARKLLMPTSDCLVIENTEAGMMAASEAGMQAIQVSGTVEEIAVSQALPSFRDLDLPFMLARDKQLLMV